MKSFILLACLLMLSSCNNVQSSKANPVINSAPIATNIILMVGDGMGLAQISAAMQVDGRTLNLERAPIIGLIKTSSSDEQITDSAASATAFATGKKTQNESVGVDAKGRVQLTILERLGQDGYATGLIATSTITHATPASFFAHQTNRQMYYSIAADMVSAPVNLFIGGGKKHFQNRLDARFGDTDNRNIIQELESNGFSFVNSVDQLKNVDGKVGFFLADEHPDPVLKGRGDVLPKLIRPSIDSLQNQSDKGFFLVVEGSQIDWGDHNNDHAYSVSELYDFDDAVGQALDFAQKDQNTLVVITADHETGGLTLPSSDIESENPYRTATATYSTNGHTSVMVPVFTYGPGAELFSGIYENTEIHAKMLQALGR